MEVNQCALLVEIETIQIYHHLKWIAEWRTKKMSQERETRLLNEVPGGRYEIIKKAKIESTKINN